MTFVSFAGQTALILHRADHHREALEAQLHRIGLSVRCAAPAAVRSEHEIGADVIFFDADTGHDSLFPWGRSPPPMPLVAILGSEAPGRLEWALAQSVSAFMVKPIGSSGAFQALVVARHLHGETNRLLRSVSELSERVRARPLVVRAVLETMRCHQLDELAALSRMRRVAMASRVTVEELSASIVAAPALAARLTEDTPALTMIARRDRRSIGSH